MEAKRRKNPPDASAQLGTDEKDRGGVSRRQFLAMGAGAAAGAAAAACGCRPKIVHKPAAGKKVDLTVDRALEPFEVNERTVRKVMARALGRGGFCDLYFQRQQKCVLVLEDSAVNRAYTLVDRGVGVRVVMGSQTGYAFTESLDEQSMVRAAEVAAAVASGQARSVPAAFKVTPARRYYPSGPVWDGVPAKKKVDLLTDLDRRVRIKDKRIKKVLVSYRDEQSQVVLLDSDGRLTTDHAPMTVTYVRCVGEHEGRRESNYYSAAGRAGMDFYTDKLRERIARMAVERTTVLFDSVAGPVGEMPVVLAPGSSGILLHEAIGHGMEADFARKKITIYTDRIGKRIAPDFVTIVDDGTNHGYRGSINADDEGNSSQRTVLVENGILRTFMHDRISAKHFKIVPTGNGRRQSFRHMPVPRMRNTYMKAGPHRHEEIIRSVKRGIYAVNFTNGQVFIGAGDFTFYVKTGFMIENGKLTRPIKDINIIGNGPKVLEKVKMVGNNPKMDEGGWTCGKRGQRVPVGLGLPTVLVGAVTVGGTSQKAKPSPGAGSKSAELYPEGSRELDGTGEEWRLA
jgi:TldD protein